MTIDAETRYSVALEAIAENANKIAVQNAITASAKYFCVPEDGFLKKVQKAPSISKGSVLWRINKWLQEPNDRSAIAQAIADGLRQHLKSSEIKTGDVFNGPQAQKFDDEGIAMFPDVVSSTDTSELFQHFSGLTDHIRESSLLHHKISDVAHAPHVLRIAGDRRILEIVRHHLGVPGIIVGLNAWWSTSGGEKLVGAQMFHRDRDDFRACKLFVYLNDTGTRDGPHIFVRGSHRSDAVKSALNASGQTSIPVDDFFNHHSRNVAHLIDQIFGSSVLEINGNAGTCFLENTYGFHRGKTPEGGQRCLLQIVYGLLPYPPILEQLAQTEFNMWPQDCEDHEIVRHAFSFLIKQ